MANKIIVDYLRRYSGQYKLEDLKKKIISSGYNEKEVEEAIGSLGLREQKKEMKLPSMPSTPSASSTRSTNLPSTSRPDQRRWIKISWICGILIIIFAILFAVLTTLIKSDYLQITVGFVSLVLGIFFNYGFIALGKKYDKKLIKVIGWMFIVLGVLAFAFQILSLVSPEILGELLIKEAVDQATLGAADVAALFAALGTILFVLIAAVLVLIILGILLGVGILKLKEEVEYAKATGILMIVGFSTLVIGIGALVLIAAYIFEIIMLAKESRKD